MSVKPETERRQFTLATRGSALALAQAHYVLDRCRQAMPDCQFTLKIVKTTGDKLQTAALANPDLVSTKGLFTKELEVALQDSSADLAVHSLKDLPTELPPGLALGAVCVREDPRDVLLYRDARLSGDKRGFAPHLDLQDLPQGAIVATGSTRRQAQLSALRPDLHFVPLRGNVPTRLRKLAERPEFDATILALAGLRRLHYHIEAEGRLALNEPPPQSTDHGAEPSDKRSGRAKPESLFQPKGLLATVLEPAVMLPCIGQGAIGIEVSGANPAVKRLCEVLDHRLTHLCVLAERAFLRTMGGGCQSPLAAYAEATGSILHLRAVSFQRGPAERTELSGPIEEAEELGRAAAEKLKLQSDRNC